MQAAKPSPTGCIKYIKLWDCKDVTSDVCLVKLFQCFTQWSCMKYRSCLEVAHSKLRNCIHMTEAGDTDYMIMQHNSSHGVSARSRKDGTKLF